MFNNRTPNNPLHGPETAVVQAGLYRVNGNHYWTVELARKNDTGGTAGVYDSRHFARTKPQQALDYILDEQARGRNVDPASLELLQHEVH